MSPMRTIKRAASAVGGTIGAVAVVIAVIFSGSSCAPAKPPAYVCKVTYPANPNGPAACIGNTPVFAPPSWVLYGTDPVVVDCTTKANRNTPQCKAIR